MLFSKPTPKYTMMLYLKNTISRFALFAFVLISTHLPAQVILQALEAGNNNAGPGVRYFSSQTRSASKVFTRNNCPAGQVGGTRNVTRTVTFSAYSPISQSDADTYAGNMAYSEALRLVNEEGQAEANANATCTPTSNPTPTPPTPVPPRISRYTCKRSTHYNTYFNYPIDPPPIQQVHLNCNDIFQGIYNVDFQSEIDVSRGWETIRFRDGYCRFGNEIKAYGQQVSEGVFCTPNY